MHNIKDLRKNLNTFKKKLKDRNIELDHTVSNVKKNFIASGITK